MRVDAYDLTETLLAIADDWAELGGSPADAALRSLERVRQQTGAATAVLWVVADDCARRMLHVGKPATIETTVDFGADSIPLERLRRHGAIRISAGEMSGVEQLVPPGLRSYVVAAATRHGRVLGVLAVGWEEPTPPATDRGIAELRIAASLLLRSFVSTPTHATPSTLPLDVLNSFIDPIVIIDRDGRISAVNAAWRESTRRQALFADAIAGVGANYFDVCRRSAAQGSIDAARTLAGLMDVCNGVVQAFERAYECSPSGETRWWLLRVVPLRRPEGGAIIRHVEITGSTTVELTRILGAEQFREFADALQVPVITIDPTGLLLFGNAQWREATGRRLRNGVLWTDAVHPDDRHAAAAALRSAVATRGGFEVDVRLLSGDGTYRWWTADAGPHVDEHGELRGFVVSCGDITPARHAQQALREAGTRLIGAQEAVRSRIARELHDDLGQQVVMLATRMDAVLHQDRLSVKQLRPELARLHDGLQELARAIHNLSHELHPAKLRLLGLERTVSSLSRDTAASSGVRVTFQSEGVLGAVPEDRALCIFRIAQEALQNAVKHSGARTVEVRLIGSPAHITLTVADDGVGFDSLALSTGLGLLTMRERVELIGGTLHIHTERATGTTIEATVPITSPEAART